MKFTIAAVFAFAAMAMAYPENFEVVKRQGNLQNQVDVGAPAMTDRTGQVVPFNAANVYQDAKARGI
ncbi:hypothetical protein B0H67DRAFT_641775 [Lasiosphaeris hirsuta]|uniref:Uncharacterized protein n=1 Tax=Lasiosphaeris hirsuta TaxID=260670 RepID=A0AA40B0C3_9PEZI|nr:hypothetical protein B0H67DRAFT_641775 [Lasiosphaeris hirsuta]